MKRFLLDTNVLSNLIKPPPSDALLAWLATQTDETLFIASLTVSGIKRGILKLPAGRKRAELETWFAGPAGPPTLFAGRILPFDEPAGLVWARLMAVGKAQGRPRDALDMILAAIAEIHGCLVVTDNEKDFAGLDYVNPMQPMRGSCRR